MMHSGSVNNKKVLRRVSAGMRLREDYIALAELVRVRRGYEHMADVYVEAVERLLADEGLLSHAA